MIIQGKSFYSILKLIGLEQGHIVILKHVYILDNQDIVNIILSQTDCHIYTLSTGIRIVVEVVVVRVTCRGSIVVGVNGSCRHR